MRYVKKIGQSYYVRIGQGKPDPTIEKFSIKDYPNEEACCTAAQKFRDIVVKAKGLDKHATDAIGRRCKIGQSFNSRAQIKNFPGIKRATRTTGGKYKVEQVEWVAEISMNGKRKQRRFSVAKYGEKEAFRLAAIVRELWLQDKAEALQNGETDF